MKKIINYIKTHSKFFEIGSMLIAALTCVTATFVIWITYGWFVNNDKGNANGVEITSNGDSVHYRDYIQIKRTLSGKETISWYKRDSSSTDTSYYKIVQDEKSSWDYEYAVTTNTDGTTTQTSDKIPMTLTNIFPNETIDITIWYYPDETVKSNTYQIYLANLKDHDDTSDFGRFSVQQSSTAKEVYHSVFGVFKAGELVTTTSDDGTSSQDFASTGTTYLTTYNDIYEDDTSSNLVKFKDGSFETENQVSVDKFEDSEKDSYYTTTFRIKLDLKQFNEVFEGKISTNKLSEKYVEIGAIRIIA